MDAKPTKPSTPVEKLLWIDMEMTGLDVQKEVIIEVAALVTDFNYKVLETYEAIVRQPQSYLDAMDEWNTKHHGESGLTAKVPAGLEPSKVESDLCNLVRKHFSGTEKPMICGNSIAQDRLFINKYFRSFEALLHYRMLDVSSWKIVMNNKYNKKYEKKNTHRALEDILESIEELKYYTQFIKLG
ncbi:MAG: oligoribonuclease [Pseudobdellovibrionaceae bacterium]